MRTARNRPADWVALPEAEIDGWLAWPGRMSGIMNGIAQAAPMAPSLKTSLRDQNENRDFEYK